MTPQDKSKQLEDETKMDLNYLEGRNVGIELARKEMIEEFEKIIGNGGAWVLRDYLKQELQKLKDKTK